MLKKLGRMLSAPIRVPMQKAKEKTMKALVMLALRNALKLAGVAGVLSDSDLERGVGAVMILWGLAMSLFKWWREHKTAQQPA